MTDDDGESKPRKPRVDAGWDAMLAADEASEATTPAPASEAAPAAPPVPDAWSEAALPPIEVAPPAAEVAPAAPPSGSPSTYAPQLSGTRSSGAIAIPPLPPDAPLPADAPLYPDGLPSTELRDAVGLSEPMTRRRGPPPIDLTDDDDVDDGPRGPRRRRPIVVSVVSIVVGLSIAGLVFLGRANSARYVIACEPDRVVVEQGRGFPPWGTRTLDDAEWKPIKISPEAECHPRETEDEHELASWYLGMLIDQASGLLTAREVTRVDDAETQLRQALLVTRLLASDDDRRDKRKEIERLLGDVVYWRASAKLRSAADALTEAAKQFDAAAAQRPRHVSDAAAWATYVRKLADQLRTGPSGATAATTFPPLPTPERPTAPAGVALPVEPADGSAGSAAPAADVTSPPDGGLPTGGVLL